MSEHRARVYLGLEMLRGLCALGIAAYHFVDWTFAYDLQSLGMFGVYIFFILSAVVLMVRYGSAFGQAVQAEEARRFYRNRFARIMPLLALIAGTAYVYLEWRSGGQSLARAILTGSGLFALQMPGFLSNTPGAWSLGIELLFYALFPVVCLLVSQLSAFRLGAVLAVAVAAQQVLLSALPASHDPDFWGKYTMPLTFVPFFAMGILIHRAGPVSCRRPMWGSLLCLLAIAAYSAVFRGDLFEGGAAYLLLSGLSGLAVFLAFQADLSGWPARLARLLGNISYSVYLSHWLVFEIAFRMPNLLLRGTVFTIGVPLLGAALYHLYERPLRDRLRAR